ncbi:MAG TPA: type II toxin-antitoxin system RelE/ParE family toxin [Nitrososphaerales archaeon]
MSKYKIQIQEDVLKALKKMDSNLKKRFDSAINDLLEDPLRFKPLRYELKGLYSARIGDFRLIYEISGNSIIIYTFEHRKKAYR